MAAERLDVFPEDSDWQPKSDFFKALWREAEFKRTHTKMKLECPHCHKWVTMELSFPGDQPQR